MNQAGQIGYRSTCNRCLVYSFWLLRFATVFSMTSLFLKRSCCTLFMMWVIGVAEVLIGITIPKESCNKPNEQQGRHRYGHDHVFDLMTQVHKLCYDIEGLGSRKDDVQDIEHQLHGMVVRSDEHTYY